MTHIDRIGLPSDLKRRNFLIGSGAAGLAFGYVAVGHDGISDALARRQVRARPRGTRSRRTARSP